MTYWMKEFTVVERKIIQVMFCDKEEKMDIIIM
jgi:hypothetical protein